MTVDVGDQISVGRASTVHTVTAPAHNLLPGDTVITDGGPVVLDGSTHVLPVNSPHDWKPLFPTAAQYAAG